MANEISMDDLHEKKETFGNRLNQDIIIVDVRTPEEYLDGHVPGSKNFPVDEIEHHVQELKKYKEIYVYCLAGGRVRAATQILEQAGISNLHCVFKGGFPNWAARGFEIEFE